MGSAGRQAGCRSGLGGGTGWNLESAVICSAAQLLEPKANVLPLASVVNKRQMDNWPQLVFTR